MSSRPKEPSKTAAALAAIGAHMDRIAMQTPLGPWREPVNRRYDTPEQTKARILALMDRLNAQSAAAKQAAE